jgi:hypothetical protein
VRILEHVSDLPSDHPAYEIAGELLSLVGPGEGYLVLIEPEDLDRTLDLPELPLRLDRIPWEGVTRERGYFHAVHLTNNEFGIGFLIPDSVDGRLRARLEEHLR